MKAVRDGRGWMVRRGRSRIGRVPTKDSDELPGRHTITDSTNTITFPKEQVDTGASCQCENYPATSDVNPG